MNREIKFRVYDKKLKKYMTLKEYQDLHAIEVETDGTLILSPRYRFMDSMMIDTDAFDVQEFTGLHDKNGKEIYESDIVEVTRQCIWEKGIVVFIDGCFFIKVKETLLALYECEPNNYQLEVIGNIYENPELLKGADNIE
jgi:uncharacterized phage protein (TIGR01671 family)